jgi:hypothetical protein
LVALVICPDIDYHWYRLDSDGKWSGKGGDGPATQLDASGDPVLDPELADRNYGLVRERDAAGHVTEYILNYSEWGGFWAVKTGQTVR